ncbi:MAG: hypothetical protein RLZ26_409 [Pseudomonadota bacterium]|jgi:methylenetetrahydrofolate reductase (NADPH)
MTEPAARLSFEFFPPKNIEATFDLWETVRALAPFRPEFVSVTYGAGGSTRALTHDAVRAIARGFDLRVAAHLTCVGQSRAETLAIAEAYAEAGVRDIVALRGDMPGGAPFTPHPEGFASAVDLVAALGATGRFSVRVGAYPDPHPESRGRGSDLDWLRAKVDAGASAAITQFFFEAETFLRFRDACADAGIDVPVIPGILPIEGWAGVRRFATRCGVPVPGWLDEAFAAATRDGRERLLALALATEMCDRLIGEGVGHLHIYTLNRATLARDLAVALGLGPARPALDRVA